MNVWITIPTGQRAEKAEKVARLWREKGFKVAAYAWDEETFKRLYSIPIEQVWQGKRKSFAILQNYMAKTIEDWDVIICGADDLYPVSDVSIIEKAAEKCDDKILWVRDMLWDKQITHPVITRKWYDKYGFIFDERFKHGYCDTDLFLWASKKGEIVKCFDIAFDHRTWRKTGRENKDEIYELADSWSEDDKNAYYDKYKDSDMMLGFVPTLFLCGGEK